MVRKGFGFLLLVLLLIGCNSPEKRFTEVAKSAGVNSLNQLQPTEELNIISYLYYYNGGGVAATDISGDGLPDLYFTNNQGPNRYFINEGNWKFREASEVARVTGSGDWSTGVSVTDVNQDGRPDIYVCNVAGYLGLEGGNELFIQQADGTFRESAKDFGLDFEGFATQAYWLDYDNDGDLDCYLLCHSVHNDATYGKADFRNRPDARAGDRLYECVQKDGQPFYQLVSDLDYRSSKANETAAGIYNSKIGYGLSAAINDFNLDGAADIYVCNDFSENDYLYINNRGQKPTLFTESVAERMGHTSNFSMGSAVGDFDNDGWPDLFTLDMRPADPVTLKHTMNADPYNVYRIKRELSYYDQYPRNNLQWNRGNGYFSEIGQQAGIAASDWSWSALAADFDLDGHQDIFVTNGIWRRPNDLDFLKFISQEKASKLSNLELSEQMPAGLVPNVAFQNQGDLTFQDVAAEWGLDLTGASNGAAYADFDQDGDLDLVVNNLNAPTSLYRNNTIDHRKDDLDFSTSATAFQEYASPNYYLSGRVVVKWEPNLKPRWLAYELSDGTTRRFFPNTQAGMLSQSENCWIFQLPEGVEITGLSDIRNQPSPNDRSIEGLETPKNPYVDFDADPLQPFALSNEGPAAVIGEIGGEEVVYVGGNQSKRMRLRKDAPDLPLLTAKQVGDLLADSIYADTDAVFFDADGDGDQDLYVVSGGGQVRVSAKLFRDRLYLWENGSFRRCDDCLTDQLIDNGSCVVAADFDVDGDLDLFVGSRNIPGYYGLSGTSRILLNDGAGFFSKSDTWPGKIGMVTDVLWKADTRELIVSAEWQPIRSFQFSNDQWQAKAISPAGLWRCLFLDGDHLYAGNWGLNSGLGQPSEEEPLRLYLADLDGNGQSDPLISIVQNGKEIPLADKDEIAAQLPSWKRNNLSYAEFAAKDFGENFTNFKLPQPMAVAELGHLKIDLGKQPVSYERLPVATQISCVNTIAADSLGVWMGGNQSLVLPRVGRQDAAALQFMDQDGKIRYIAQTGFGTQVTGIFFLAGGKKMFVQQ